MFGHFELACLYRDLRTRSQLQCFRRRIILQQPQVCGYVITSLLYIREHLATILMEAFIARIDSETQKDVVRGRHVVSRQSPETPRRNFFALLHISNVELLFTKATLLHLLC